jgi:hypothetical protein
MNDNYGTQRTNWESQRRIEVIELLIHINDPNIRFYSHIQGTIVDSLYRTCIVLNYYGNEIYLSWNLLDLEFTDDAFIKLDYNGNIYNLPSSDNFYNDLKNSCNCLL